MTERISLTTEQRLSAQFKTTEEDEVFQQERRKTLTSVTEIGTDGLSQKRVSSSGNTGMFLKK